MPGLETFVLKGNLLYTREPSRLECFPDHYLVCENGCVAGIFPCLPDRYAHVAVEDCGSRLIVPGLTDLHLHAPQYAFRGLGMDLELLDWLDSHTFPEESRYADPVYAERAYRLFVRDLQMSTTTRACIFATIHADATLLLMQLLEETGLVAMVGKVNMDMNSPESYCETTDGSLAETERWIRESLCRYKNVSPILTPRFAPVCSGRLMASLGRLQQKYALPL